MLILTVKLPDRKKCILACAAAAAVLLAAAAFALSRSPGTDALAPADAGIGVCLECLEGFGWEVDPTPVNTEASVLSTELNTAYLALQTEAGFDLSDDLGHAVTRYTFTVLNYPTGEQGILADLLVRDGAVVGGDIRTSDLNGFIHSLNMPDAS